MGLFFKKITTDPETITGPHPDGSFRLVDAEGRTAGKLGSGTDEKIKLDTAEDMAAVRAFIHQLQDEPDKARAVVRALSPRDRAVLLFDLGELSRIVSEEEGFRTMEDRRTARRSHESSAYPDGYDV